MVIPVDDILLHISKMVISVFVLFNNYCREKYDTRFCSCKTGRALTILYIKKHLL